MISEDEDARTVAVRFLGSLSASELGWARCASGEGGELKQGAKREVGGTEAREHGGDGAGRGLRPEGGLLGKRPHR